MGRAARCGTSWSVVGGGRRPDGRDHLETAIDTLRADRTLLAMAHRESTIKRLSRVVHLDEGSVLVRPS